MITHDIRQLGIELQVRTTFARVEGADERTSGVERRCSMIEDQIQEIMVVMSRLVGL